MFFGHFLALRIIDIVLANAAVQHAIAQFQRDVVFVCAHMIAYMWSTTSEKNAVQTGEQLWSGAATFITQTG